MIDVVAVLILRAPSGSGIPLWVRESWVGLTLPIIGMEVVRCERWRTSIWGRVSRWFEIGITDRQLVYLVDFKMAFAILCCERPEAAEWWFANHPDGETLAFSARYVRPIWNRVGPALALEDLGVTANAV